MDYRDIVLRLERKTAEDLKRLLEVHRNQTENSWFQGVIEALEYALDPKPILCKNCGVHHYPCDENGCNCVGFFPGHETKPEELRSTEAKE